LFATAFALHPAVSAPADSETARRTAATVSPDAPQRQPLEGRIVALGKCWEKLAHRDGKSTNELLVSLEDFEQQLAVFSQYLISIEDF